MGSAVADEKARTTDRIKGTVAGMARHHLRPLALIELIAFTIALLLGWTIVALAILAWHVLRMGVAAVGYFRAKRHT